MEDLIIETDTGDAVLYPHAVVALVQEGPHVRIFLNSGHSLLAVETTVKIMGELLSERSALPF